METGDHLHELEALLTRSEVHFRRDLRASAVADAEATLSGALAHGDRYIEALARYQLSKVLLATSDPAQAMRTRNDVGEILSRLGIRRDRMLEAVVLSNVDALRRTTE
jgi:hypothetical protein